MNFKGAIAKPQFPEYITPDYSGQGTAIKLNSYTTDWYIHLARSPIFFNQTFTISVWLRPIAEESKVYGLFSQIYLTASPFVLSITDQHAVMSIYNTRLWSSTKLKNYEWQHVTFAFDQPTLSMAIYIDGAINGHTLISSVDYSGFLIQQTTIGSYGNSNLYSGIMDQLSITFRTKTNIDILDEATLVAHYNFVGDTKTNDFLFNDNSANSIRAQGVNVSYLIDSRRSGQNTLILTDPDMSYFQSNGFILLSSHDHSYSYALWLNISSASSFIPLVHLAARIDTSVSLDVSGVCLTMLVANRTGKVVTIWISVKGICIFSAEK